MEVHVIRRGVFTPRWNNNPELPEPEQVRVRWRHLTYEESQSIALEFDNLGSRKQYAAYKNRIYAAMTEGIDNLCERDDEGEAIVIDSYEKLLSSVAFLELKVEIDAYYDRLSVIDKKKSKSESAS
jgi:hypothetical protein